MQLVLIKLALAALVGLILGIEREAKHKPLGLKTCVVISIASCLLTIVSIEAAFETHNGESFIRADPMRLAAQIISGVGFLGAGVILRRSNDVISGLTTAAIVWAASGFGIAIGAGYFYEVGIAVVLVSITVVILPFIVQKIGPHALREQEVRLHVFVRDNSDLTQVAKEIRDLVIDVKDIKLKGHVDGHKIEARCTINQGAEELFIHYNRIQKIPGVTRAEIDSI
ncbi:MgtC/SapB family protein [Virgibacillus sp. MSJ-26]|uniref:MgtC/SapB family protein n=1 Tax=Virgibacillus sp. MSJ-26 TaxID=2841522 RepID=UPI001C12139F|nr:MgtC/SapB family protein [Virgibacillus sp. MSJ-26]MBU5465320.1 MgtC/SapB family protein [Virgibacillus sp. MSJ-26]